MNIDEFIRSVGNQIFYHIYKVLRLENRESFVLSLI